MKQGNHHLSHTPSFTHHLSHTSLSTTIFHTPSLTHHLGDIHLHFAWQAWHLRHWAGSGGALGGRAIRGLLVVKSTAGTVHTVGCACVLYADVCEVHLCRTCVRTPPSPDHLLFVTREDRSRLAHRDLGCRWLGNGGFDAIKVCRLDLVD